MMSRELTDRRQGLVASVSVSSTRMPHVAALGQLT